MTEIQTWKVTEPYLSLNSPLLEGPSHNPKTDQLRFIDILTDEVFLVNLSDGPQSLTRFKLPGDTVTTLAGIKGSDLLLVSAKYGFATLDVEKRELRYFRRYFDDADGGRLLRANDGAIDARGRIYQGIMPDEKHIPHPLPPTGSLLVLDKTGTQTTLVHDVVCPNGLGWNRANVVLDWAESHSGNVYVFDYELETGEASGQRVWFHLDPMDNTNAPDGLVVDAEDHVWLAVWGAGKVLRISPAGVVVGEVLLPTRFVTCPVFVGTALYITTAAEREPEVYPESARYGGCVYRVEVGVGGLPKFEAGAVECYAER